MVKQPATVIGNAMRLSSALGRTIVTKTDLLNEFALSGYGMDKTKKWIATYTSMGLLEYDAKQGGFLISNEIMNYAR